MPGPTPLPVRLTDKQRAELLLLREDDNSRLRARAQPSEQRGAVGEGMGCIDWYTSLRALPCSVTRQPTRYSR